MISLENRKIGPKQPVFMIAELSGNHNHDINRAYALLDAAKKAGADAIKLQTYTPDTITLNADTPDFIVQWQGKDKTLYELYKEAYTPWEWHKDLFEYAKKLGLICFSTPFDATAVTFLETLNTPLYKVASFEVVDIPLLEAIGKTKKPVIMSRGMATLEELQLAVDTLKKAGTKELVILQCVSAYPAKPKDMHLQNIPDLVKRFGVSAGLSDHTLTSESAIAAVALGACAIEKHLTLKRSDGGPDSEFSLEPEEFAQLVASVRIVEQAVAEPFYEQSQDEKALSKFRKSLFAAKAIAKGELFTESNVRSVRPGAGLAPKHYHDILGKRAKCDIPFATPLSWDLVD
jgi:N-acetylneuraminate synthase